MTTLAFPFFARPFHTGAADDRGSLMTRSPFHLSRGLSTLGPLMTRGLSTPGPLMTRSPFHTGAR